MVDGEVYTTLKLRKFRAMLAGTALLTDHPSKANADEDAKERDGIFRAGREENRAEGRRG